MDWLVPFASEFVPGCRVPPERPSQKGQLPENGGVNGRTGEQIVLVLN